MYVIFFFQSNESDIWKKRKKINKYSDKYTHPLKTRHVELFILLSDLYLRRSSNKSLIAVTPSTNKSGNMAISFPKTFNCGSQLRNWMKTKYRLYVFYCPYIFHLDDLAFVFLVALCDSERHIESRVPQICSNDKRGNVSTTAVGLVVAKYKLIRIARLAVHVLASILLNLSFHNSHWVLYEKVAKWNQFCFLRDCDPIEVRLVFVLAIRLFGDRLSVLILEKAS
jgi:hypothetical protein